MNPVMPMSKFISTKTTMLLRSNCGRITLEFAVLILPCMVSGKSSALERILKQRAVIFRGLHSSLGNPLVLGNCHISFSRTLTKNANMEYETQHLKNPVAFVI